ncbi:MAG: class I SAM-dependent methyltransferase [Chloroflexota bacterium]|nr:class I SAM-dependent methyltransferase [Chloroflexota bacterium]
MRRDVQRDFYTAAYRAGSPSRSGLLGTLELHRVDAALRLVPGGVRLLDVGCGDGALLEKAADRFQHLTGVDVSDAQLAAARARLHRRADLVQANVDRGLPFRSREFDTVTAIAVLSFVFDPVALLEEIKRVLRPGGLLALEVLNLVYLPRRLRVLVGQLPAQTSCHGWEGGHLHNFTRPALLRLLDERGFRVERCTGSGVLTPLRTWWPGLLLGNVIATARS